MSANFVLPVDAIRDGLNRDPEFVLAARFWYADIRFEVGDEPYFMHVENGIVTRFKHGTEGFDPYEINIGGSTETWLKMMEEKPEPFYHDWLAACFHHEFEISGDLGSAYAYYFALRRIHAVMGQCVRALDKVA